MRRSLVAAAIMLVSIIEPPLMTMGGTMSKAAIDSASAQLKTLADPITTPKSSSNLADLSLVGSAIGDARIVGLGEASHGSSEIYIIKLRLLQYLVEHKGFSVLAVEGDWSNWRTINSYVQGGPGTASDVLKRQDFSIYRTFEMRRLIEWMRSYNKSAGHDKRIRVVGIDFQEPSDTYRIIQSYVALYLPQSFNVVRAIAQCYGTTPANGGQTTGQNARATCARGLSDLGETIRAHRALTRGDAAARTEALTAIDILTTSEPVMSESGDPLAARDRVLAKNAAYFLDKVYPTAKMAVWAHDGHVATSFRYDTMGEHLRSKYGPNYFAIGTLIGSGQVRAKPKSGVDVHAIPIDVPTDTGVSSQALFEQVGAPFFLDLRTVPSHTPLANWLAAPQKVWFFGGVVDPKNLQATALAQVTLSRSFDAVLFLPISRATKVLQ